MIQRRTHTQFYSSGHKISYNVDARDLTHSLPNYSSNCQNYILHTQHLIVMIPYRISMFDLPPNSLLHVCWFLMLMQGCFPS